MENFSKDRKLKQDVHFQQEMSACLRIIEIFRGGLTTILIAEGIAIIGI